MKPWQIITRSRAEKDLRTIQRWYENRRAGLGDEFLGEFEAAVKVLERNPRE